jgi:hypothetical protein
MADNSSISGALPVRRAKAPSGSPLRAYSFLPLALQPEDKKAGTKDWSRQVLAGCPDKIDKTKFQSDKVSKFQSKTALTRAAKLSPP